MDDEKTGKLLKIILIILVLLASIPFVFVLINTINSGISKGENVLYLIALAGGFVLATIASITRKINASNYYMKKMLEWDEPIMQNEGNNRSYSDIVSLLELIKVHDKKYKIELTGISSKEQLKTDKKYSVEIFTFEGGYITEINIKEQNDIE